jgi:nitrous oxidase accessory protein NosD
MQRKIWCSALVLAVLLGSSLAWADDIYVIAGGGGVGTPITTVPYVIAQPGFYYLKKNLTTANTTDTAIIIASNNVTLDLMGFAISAPTSSSGDGVRIGASINVEVRNGAVSNFTNGIYSDYYVGGYTHRLVNLRASFCGVGIFGSADGIIVSGCQAAGCGDGFVNNGGYGAVYEKNTAMYNSNSGFYFYAAGSTLINNVSCGNTFGFILPADPSIFVDRNAAFTNNTANYTGLAGCTVGLNTP